MVEELEISWPGLYLPEKIWKLRAHCNRTWRCDNLGQMSIATPRNTILHLGLDKTLSLLAVLLFLGGVPSNDVSIVNNAETRVHSCF
jgi:hypothetical protein